MQGPNPGLFFFSLKLSQPLWYLPEYCQFSRLLVFRAGPMLDISGPQYSS